jgi:hypothetical protein
MLQFLDSLVHYADPTLPSFSSLTYLYMVILLLSLAGAIRSKSHQDEIAQ